MMIMSFHGHVSFVFYDGGELAVFVIDGLSHHCIDIVCSVGLHIHSDEAIFHQVMQRVKPLVRHIVFAIEKETKVLCTVIAPNDKTEENSWFKQFIKKDLINWFQLISLLGTILGTVERGC